MSALTLRAPAKLNLGLAVTGRRPDGYHSLATIFQTIDLHDTLELSVPVHPPTSSWTGFSCTDPALEGRNNLVVKTVEAVRAAARREIPIDIRLRKTIPAAAGLGGASSDAATTLKGLRKLWNLSFTTEELESIAGKLGSDVPFFIRGGCALGEGRGEVLRPLPVQDVWYVVVFPTQRLPFDRKTAAMFGALEPRDFTNGDAVYGQARRLDAGMPLDPALLTNAFERPLYALVPELNLVNAALRDAGATHVAISGAGPTHFAAVATNDEAHHIAQGFTHRYEGEAIVFVCRSFSP